MILLAIVAICGLLGAACAIASLVFFVMVVIQMFQREESKTLGIICVVLTFVTGVGPIIAFIFGWTKVKEWDLKKVMTSWTVAFVLQFIFLGIAFGAILTGSIMLTPQPQLDMDVPSLSIDFGSDFDDFGSPEEIVPDVDE
jgi:hypothetical protein